MSTGIFSAASIDAIVGAQLATLPTGHVNAIVGTVDQQGAQVIAGFALGPDQSWIFQGAYRHDWTGANTVGGKVIYSW